MFKLLPTTVLFLALLAQTFNRAVIVTEYYANTAAYAKNCENKAKPQMHCNGKCQMMKKLKQEANKDQQNPERRSNNQDEVISSKSFFATIGICKTFSLTSFSIYHSGSPVDKPADFFHPPGA